MGSQPSSPEKEGDFREIFQDLFVESVRAAQDEYGPAFALGVIVIIALGILHERLWLRLLKEKNREIDRIAKERDKWDDYVLGELQSSNLDSEGNPREIARGKDK